MSIKNKVKKLFKNKEYITVIRCTNGGFLFGDATELNYHIEDLIEDGIKPDTELISIEEIDFNYKFFDDLHCYLD